MSNNSPKTPGGISKSLLTPCRRVGLSRKFRKAGPSPFVSPLSKENCSPPVKLEEKRTSRKERVKVQECDVEVQRGDKEICDKECEPTLEKEALLGCDMELVSTPVRELSNIYTTPLRSAQPSRKNNSKTKNTDMEQIVERISQPAENEMPNKNDLENTKLSKVVNNTEAKLVRSLSKTKKSTSKLKQAVTESGVKNNNVSLPKNSNSICKNDKSPNNLSTECFVIVQRKIFKDSLKQSDTANLTSQAVFDSDSDDAPLSTITNKKEDKLDTDVKKRPRTNEDDDFLEKPNCSIKVKKLEHKKTSTTDLKKEVTKKSAKEVKGQLKQASMNLLQTSLEDDDDDEDFECKKTTFIRTYGKVIKPGRAKSTGSITQQDIEQLKARIESKKNLLLAKSMNNETEELRSLIKKWRRGCQEALSELTDLMKIKLGDQNMNSSDILKMLKIPTKLVGYDSDNDCFISPDDSSVILYNY